MRWNEEVLIRGAAALACALLYVVFWWMLGPGEILGSDRAHVYILHCNATTLYHSFADVADRYRPLSVFVEGSLTCAADRSGLTAWWALVLLNALLTGIACSLIIAISRRLNGSL